MSETTNGKPGGLTARYYVNDKLVLTRQEKDIDYQYLKDVDQNWPKELGDPKKASGVKVVWDATMTSDKAGVHKMKLYSSDYAKLDIDGKQVMDVWRQGWNPWYHNVELKLEANKPVKLHLEWKPSGGMIAMTHSDPLPAPERHSLTFSSEVAQSINYYVINGETSIDKVIAGYRHLTGEAPMMPKWSYGLWQSRQRYETQDQLLGVLSEYRKQGWPIDNMVQDWFYWPQDGWGSHDFDKARFPDPKGMVDEIHKKNARIMISIWGKFYENTDNYQELKKNGYMWTKNVENGDLDWVGPGYKNSHYDPYTKGARDLVGTALVIALARGTMILARDAQIIDTMLHALTPLVQSSSPIFTAWKMFGIQTVINFFIHSGTGQAALTMPIMAPLADLVGVTRQTAILAFQFGELTTPMIPTSGITVGVLALARVPWITWAKWMIPLQLIYAVMALALLVPPVLMHWQ